MLPILKYLAKNVQARAYTCCSGECEECCPQVEYPLNGVVAGEPYSDWIDSDGNWGSAWILRASASISAMDWS